MLIGSYPNLMTIDSQYVTISLCRYTTVCFVKISLKGSTDEARAQVAIKPSLQAAVSICIAGNSTFGELDATAVLDALEAQIKAGVTAETLAAQATTLNILFNTLTQRAVGNMGQHLHAAEVYFRLALKAQAQCARTLEVLQMMKTPQPVYINQANVAAQQIVQNGVLNVDSRTSGETVRGNTKLAAVESIHRAANS